MDFIGAILGVLFAAGSVWVIARVQANRRASLSSTQREYEDRRTAPWWLYIGACSVAGVPAFVVLERNEDALGVVMICYLAFIATAFVVITALWRRRFAQDADR